MKHRKLAFLLFVALVADVTGFPSRAEEPTDSLLLQSNTKNEESNRNVMLNASSDNGPRQISIGLPVINASDVIILENDLPVVYHYWPHMPNTHWRADASLQRVGLLSLSEVQTTTGRVGYATNSYSRLGGDTFTGLVNYRVNHFGLQQFDINLSGPLGRGWFYSASVYQNFDPGSYKVHFTNYTDRTQIYKGILTKRFDDNRGEISLLYKYSYSRAFSDSNSPFIYNGDGSISEIDGFDLGRDSYLPVDGTIRYMDIETGEMRESQIQDISLNTANEVGLMGHYTFLNHATLKWSAKYSHANANLPYLSATGIVDAEAGDGYTSSGGDAYTGKVQQRLIMIDSGKIDDLMMMMELSKNSGNHSWRIGLNEWFNKTDYQGSSVRFLHEVAADPQRLLLNGDEFYGYNSSGEYYNGTENRIALYFKDEWKITPDFDLNFGLRLEYFSLQGENIPVSRWSGFYRNATSSDGATAVTEHFSHDWLLPAISLNMTYKLTKNFGFLGEVSYSQQGSKLSDYAGYVTPYTDAVSVPYGRLGIYYNNSWISLVSAATYIKKTNYQSRFNLVDPSDATQTNLYHLKYDVQTWGWTTDVVLKPFKGAQLHFLFTLQDPKYKDYSFEAYGHEYNYNDKQVTKVSKVLMEIDPSYQLTDDIRIWASFRYYSKEYASISNVLYFEPRWETFGGVDYKVNKHLSLTAKVTNFLNQSGVSGSISGSELVTDGAQYAGQWMSGSYIRPFTCEVKASIRF